MEHWVLAEYLVQEGKLGHLESLVYLEKVEYQVILVSPETMDQREQKEHK